MVAVRPKTQHAALLPSALLPGTPQIATQLLQQVRHTCINKRLSWLQDLGLFARTWQYEHIAHRHQGKGAYAAIVSQAGDEARGVTARHMYMRLYMHSNARPLTNHPLANL
jgi:hypothetical protein